MKYKIGECHTFKGKNFLEIGEIIAAYKDKSTEKYLYDFRVCLEDHDEIIQDIKEEDIVVPSCQRPPMNEWIKEHIEEINAAFGEKMNERMLIVYDYPEQVEEELREYLNLGTRWFKPVLDKYIGVIG